MNLPVLKKIPWGLGVVSLVLLVIAAWAIFQMERATTPQTLGVVAAIAIGGYNAWVAWYKEAKAKAAGVVITPKLWRTESPGRPPSPSDVILACQIANKGKDKIFVQTITPLLMAKLRPGHQFKHLRCSLNRAAPAFGVVAIPLEPNEGVLAFWSRVTLDHLWRYGFYGIEVKLGSGESVRATCRELAEAIKRYHKSEHDELGRVKDDPAIYSGDDSVTCP
ncbi:MAG: hypothetical protein ACREJD_08300 [Phycisphaerales bacterium]